MKSPWGMFDSVSVLCYTGMPERVGPMRYEISRIGLSGRADFIWNYPNPFDAVIANGIRMATRACYVNVTLGHYRILKTAQCLGKRRVLILEDDARFLSDTNKLTEAVLSLPEDFNVAMLDNHWANGTCHREERVNCWWSRCRDRRVSSAAYALDMEGINWLVSRYEECVKFNSQGLRCCDQYFNPDEMPEGFNFYVATPNICIQKPVGATNTPENNVNGIYDKMKISITEYGDERKNDCLHG